MGQRWYEGRRAPADKPAGSLQEGCAGLVMYLALIGLILLCILVLASMAVR